ncbi:MAG: hypothetical protein ACRDV4_02580 [Acidimicrobiales bacterium]
MLTETNGRAVHHDVVVYGDPLELVRAIGELSTAALDRGAAVVLVATNAHLQAADEWIRLSGSLPASESKGASPNDRRYHTIDVDCIIDELHIVPDPAGVFERLLGAASAEVPADIDIVQSTAICSGRCGHAGRWTSRTTSNERAAGSQKNGGSRSTALILRAPLKGQPTSNQSGAATPASFRALPYHHLPRASRSRSNAPPSGRLTRGNGQNARRQELCALGRGRTRLVEARQ